MYCKIESPLKCQNLNTVQAEYRKFSIKKAQAQAQVQED